MDAFEQNIQNGKELLNLFKVALKRVQRDIRNKKWPLFIAGMILGISLYTDIGSALLWVIFLAFLIYRWDNRVLGVAAILCLTLCPLLLAINIDWSNAAAEQVAVYAFFFLAMTVVLQLIDLKRNPEAFQE